MTGTSTSPPDGVPADVLAGIAAGAASEAAVPVGLLGDALTVLVEAVAAGRRPDRAQVQAWRAAGRTAAGQGVALRALLDLYLSSAWRLWPHLPAVAAARDAPAVAAAGGVMLRAVDDAVAALTEGFQLARRSLVREQESARRELVDDLLTGGADVAGLLGRASGFGLDLAGPHAVLVVRAERPFADGTPMVGAVERAVLGRLGDADALVASKQGRLVVVAAAPDRAAVAEVVTGVTRAFGPRPGGDAAERVVELRRRSRVGPWQLGVGRPRVGAGGVLASYREALDALELAARLALDVPVVDAAELLVYRALLADRAAVADLVEAMLAPLSAARGGAQPLLDTLGAYFDAGGNAAQAARALHLSVRAVTYRLDRVRRLTGHDPGDPAERFAMQAAVLGARLLGGSRTPQR